MDTEERCLLHLSVEERLRISAFTRTETVKRGGNDARYKDWPILIDNRNPEAQYAPGAVSIQEALSIFPKTVGERMDRALLNLARIGPIPGTFILLASNIQYPLAFAENPIAADYIWSQMSAAGWIEFLPDPTYGKLAAAGWNRVAELESGVLAEKPLQGFVAMSFDPKLQTAYDEGVFEAIRDAGYDPKRMDRMEHNNRIDDEMIAEIRKSRFMVADLTNQRQNVYFEAGLAMGLGMPVIWTCQRGEVETSHFDVRQYNLIDWSDPADLRRRLRNRIEATIGPAGKRG